MAWVKKLPVKIGGSVDLYYCMECESFSSPFAPTIASPHTQVNWHKSVLERNLAWSADLLSQLKEIGVRGPIVDVGCGIGSLLLAARNFGMSGVGYDLDVPACQYGREQFDLDLRGENWSLETSPDFELISCISVLEHIHQPRDLIAQMIHAAKERKATVFLSVPFLNRDWWRFLHTDSGTSGHVFEYPHVHVTHFSHKGMETVCRQFGASSLEMVRVARGWVGFLIRP
jgi:2-polyprenyl-3-methyl-5-hydroxy-6-metoxy-1,4-benzoquinol methylase